MKILVGLSGGFDSAYTVRLLLAQGHAVEGAVLHMHDYTELGEAQAAADALGIPLHIVDCRALFEREVIDPFCEEYRAARTPNPCIICNERVKFKMLYDYAEAHGFDRIATGHYARIVCENGRLAISVAADKSKDQSYMLYRLPQSILARLILPMGGVIKREAKEEGARFALTAADRAESQDVCFVKNEGYADFIERRTGSSPAGDFVSESGEVLGRHNGIIRYTVGQRKGLGVSSATGRLFIQSIDSETARIVLADRMPRFLRFAVDQPVFSLLSREEAVVSEGLCVRVRYSAPPVPVRISEENGELICTITGECRTAITAGQSAVFYRDGVIAFGGIVKNVH